MTFFSRDEITLSSQAAMAHQQLLQTQKLNAEKHLH
jgi:hypothetical protein